MASPASPPSSPLAALRGRLSLRGASAADPDMRRQWLQVTLPTHTELEREPALPVSIRKAILATAELGSRDADAWRDALGQHCDLFLPLDVPSAELWAHTTIVVRVECRPHDDRTMLLRVLEGIFLPPSLPPTEPDASGVSVHVDIDPTRLHELESDATSALQSFLESVADVLRRITRAQRSKEPEATGVRLDGVALHVGSFSLTPAIAAFVDQVARMALRVSELSLSLDDSPTALGALEAITATITGHRNLRIGRGSDANELPAIDAISVTRAEPFALSTLCVAIAAGTTLQGLALRHADGSNSAAERDLKWRCVRAGAARWQVATAAPRHRHHGLEGRRRRGDQPDRCL
ncbi:hypothetical protein PINS_up019924 [Pythium insidiosum]|nr:hypothetical protein PINS_up019924 [Pythium insidiosum]